MQKLLFLILVPIGLSGCVSASFDGRSGTVRDHFFTRSYSNVAMKADAACASSGLGKANITQISRGCLIPFVCPSEYDEYSFTCLSSTAYAPAAVQPQYNKTIPTQTDIDSAKARCASWGFKPGTDKFAQCVQQTAN